nr:hypothetical protein [Tanacetum cinerariifolium]
MMSKKMAELEDDFREFKARTERRFVSLDMSIRAYRLEEDHRHEEDQRHEERIRRYDELKNLLLSLIQKSSSPVQSSRPITTKKMKKNMKIQDQLPRKTRMSKENKRKGLLNFLKLVLMKKTTLILCSTMFAELCMARADAGLKHGSYLLLDRIPKDGWYFFDESGLSKEPLCRSNLEVHVQFHVDQLKTRSQVKTWDPGIKIVRSHTLRTKCF